MIKQRDLKTALIPISLFYRRLSISSQERCLLELVSYSSLWKTIFMRGPNFWPQFSYPASKCRNRRNTASMAVRLTNSARLRSRSIEKSLKNMNGGSKKVISLFSSHYSVDVSSWVSVFGFVSNSRRNEQDKK